MYILCDQSIGNCFCFLLGFLVSSEKENACTWLLLCVKLQLTGLISAPTCHGIPVNEDLRKCWLVAIKCDVGQHFGVTCLQLFVVCVSLLLTFPLAHDKEVVWYMWSYMLLRLLLPTEKTRLRLVIWYPTVIVKTCHNSMWHTQDSQLGVEYLRCNTGPTLGENEAQAGDLRSHRHHQNVSQLSVVCTGLCTAGGQLVAWVVCQLPTS